MENNKLSELLVRMQKGDKSALERVYNEYFSRIYEAALYRVRNRDDAYDIAMEVFMKLCGYQKPFSEVANPMGMLYTITQNAVRDHFRRIRFRAEADIETVERSEEFEDGLWVSDMMCLLTEEEKDVFASHLIWGKSLKEISEERGCAYITVKRIYRSVKEKIKERYR